jgi:hypothetical protein
VLGEALWVIGAGALVAALFSQPMHRAVALATIMVLPPDYGGNGVFRYGEMFFSPRQFAEAFVMMALAAALKRRWLPSACTGVAAAAMHPLMAAPGLLVVGGLIAVRDRRWWWLLLVGAAAGVALAFLGIEPFVRMRAVISGDWLAIVKQRCPWTFFGQWQVWDFVRLAVQAQIAALALRSCSAIERRLLIVLGGVVAAALALSAIGGDLLDDLLIINIQPTRVLWLASVIVNLMAGATLLRLFTERSPVRWYYIIGLVAYFFAAAAPWCLGSAAATFGIALATGRVTASWPRAHRALAVLSFGVAVISAGFVLGTASMLGVYLQKFPDGTGWYCDYAAIALTVTAGVFVQIGRTRTALASATLAAALAFAVIDQRAEWQHFTDVAEPSPNVAALLGDANSIYWEDGLELLWFRLGRANYYSCVQGTGAMFYPRTAMEYDRRSRVLASLNTADFGSPNEICTSKADPHAAAPKSGRDIVAACKELGDLDVMVLMSKVDDLPSVSWTAPEVHYRLMPDGSYEKIDRYYVYDCRKLRIGA